MIKYSVLLGRAIDGKQFTIEQLTSMAKDVYEFEKSLKKVCIFCL